MQAVLKFNDMMDSLSPQEYEFFIQQILKGKDKESLKSLLFNLFVSQLFGDKHHTYFNVDEINRILTNIIQNRKQQNKYNKIMKTSKNANEIQQKRQIQIIHIPKDVINVVSSFLNTLENVNFALSSRFIFFASRSPTKFHEITRNEMHKYNAYFSKHNSGKLPKVTMDRLKYTTNLSLSCTDWIAIHYLSTNKSIWNNLTTLNLYHCNVPDFLINLNHLNFQTSHVKTLTLHDINFEIEEGNAAAIETEEFSALINILEQFPSLEFLSLVNTNSIIESAECIGQIPCISNLKGLVIRWVLPESISNFILLKCSKQLKAFHVGDNDGIFGYLRHSFPQDVKKYTFANVEELCIDGDINDEDAEILKTLNSNKLKRVCISIMNPHIYNYTMPKSVISLLCSSSLEYIALGNSLRMSLDVLSKILMVKRNGLKVKLDSHNVEKWNNDIHTRFVNMLHTLSQNTKHFMLILSYGSKLNEHLIGLKEQYVFDKHEDSLIISNFGCSLKGYHEKWLMRCELCNSC